MLTIRCTLLNINWWLLESAWQGQRSIWILDFVVSTIFLLVWMFFLWVWLISLWVQTIFQEVQSRTNSQIHKRSHKHRSSRKVTSKHICVHSVFLKSDDIDMNHKVLKFPPHYSKPKEKKPKRIQNERDKIVTKTVLQERNQVELLD